jgi:hypothetical protein
MKKEIAIVVPNDYSAITLRKYLEMHKDLETYKDDPEAVDATLFHHLCGLDPNMLHKIDNNTYSQIKEQLFSFLGKHDYPLKRTVKLGEVEYGFEPNLSDIAYGAYVDISKFDTFSIDENWASIMSILYRPVNKKVGALYTIEPYGGYTNPEFWLDVSMDVHFGAYFFFINLSLDLESVILKSLMENPEMPTNIKEILQESGELMNQSSHLRTENFSKWMK